MGKLVLTLASNFEDVKKSVIKKIEEKSDWENIIIVPDRFSLLAEQSVFQLNDLDCLINTNIMPITALAQRILNELEVNIKKVSSEEEGFLIRRAIYKTKEEFVCFSKNMSSAMCDEIAKTIAQLKSCKIKAEDLNPEEATPLLRDKLSDLKTIFTEYENILGDMADGTKMLGIFEEKTKQITSLKNTKLYFVGFDSFTPQIFEIIKGLKDVTKEIFVGGYYHFGAQNKRVFELDIFENFSKQKGKNAPEIEYVNSNLNQNQKLVFENAFASKKTKQEKVEKNYLKTYSFESFEKEIDFVLKDILHKVKKEGKPFSDFAIATPNLESDKQILEIMLQKTIINYYIDSSKNLSETNLIAFIKSFYEVVINGYKQEELFSFFGSDFAIESFEEKSRSFELMQKYALERGNFKNSINIQDKKDLQNYKELKKHFSKLKMLASQIEGQTKVEGFVNITKQLLKEYNCEEVLSQKAEMLFEQGKIKAQKIYLQIYDKTIEVLDSVESYLKDEQVNVLEFYDIIKNALMTKKVSTVPVSTDSVFVGDATDSFFDEVSNLYVLGANYDKLPKTQYDAGLINDSNIKELEQNVLITPTIKAINKRNKFKLLNLLAKAKQNLIVCYENKKEDGKETLPASFVFDLQEVFDTQNKQVFTSYEKQQEDMLKQITSLEEAKEFLFLNARKSDEVYKKTLNQVYTVLQNNNFVTDEELMLFYQGKELPKIKNARQLFFNKGRAKISQIESYFNSPFNHYLQYGLKLKELETSEINALDIGNLMHYVAQVFVEEHFVEGIKENQINESVNEILKKVIKLPDFYKFKLTYKNKNLFEYLKVEAYRMCRLIVFGVYRSNYKPMHTEKYFKIQNYFEKQGLDFAGIIDRVDETSNAFNIIDYKTGKIELSAKAVYMGQKLQLLIYADVMESLTNKTCTGVFYFPIKNTYKQAESSKLKGVFVGDVDTVFNIDKEISFENPKSSIIDASISTSKANVGSNNYVLIKNTSITNDLNSVVKYAKTLCESAIDQMLEGNIDFIKKDKPYKNMVAFENAAFKQIKQTDKFSVRYDDFNQILKEKVDE